MNAEGLGTAHGPLKQVKCSSPRPPRCACRHPRVAQNLAKCHPQGASNGGGGAASRPPGRELRSLHPPHGASTQQGRAAELKAKGREQTEPETAPRPVPTAWPWHKQPWLHLNQKTSGAKQTTKLRRHRLFHRAQIWTENPGVHALAFISHSEAQSLRPCHTQTQDTYHIILYDTI